MRYTVRQYATALLHAVEISRESDVEGIADRLSAILARDGAKRKASAVIDAAQRESRARAGGRRISIIAADDRSAKILSEGWRNEDEVSVTIDPRVEGGVSVTIDGLRYDATLKRTFDDLRAALSRP